ncbi:MAG: hypothetical protein AAFR61_12530 [Bacteroidota bacterium]
MPHSVGFRKFDVEDAALALQFPVYAFYPAEAEERAVHMGPFSLELAMQAPLAAGHFPLVVISHGSGGSPLTFRGLARDLVKKGAIVLVPEHPHNHRWDNSWEKLPKNLQARPRHLSLAVQQFRALPEFTNSLTGSMLLVGHSIGAYSVLAAAGAVPQTVELPELDTLNPKAVVLLGPGGIQAIFQDAKALVHCQAELAVYTGGLDDPDSLADTQWLGTVFSKVSHKHEALAGHYSFLTPFPPALREKVGPAGRDAHGFDRIQFLAALAQEISELW